MDENNPIYGVYFICCLNNYLEVIEEQMLLLQKGLLENTKKLIIFITKYDENDEQLNQLLLKYNVNDKFILVTSSDNPYEKIAINNYKKYIDDVDYYLYYFHTKGVSRDKTNEWFRHCTSRRQILNFYTLEKYAVILKLLKSYDAVGCNSSFFPKKHFSGNFWWSKSSYLNLLNDIKDDQGYLAPEMYILSNNECNYISLSNKVNHWYVEDYTFRNDDDILSNVTKEWIIYPEHKNLITRC